MRIASRLSACSALGLLAAIAPIATAQLTGANPRWQAWIGCWRETDAAAALLATGGPVVCVVPTAAASAVDVVTVDSGKVVSRYTVDASGTQREVNRDGCSGWERARWSKDSLRVFLSSELKCGALSRSSTGLMAISPSGAWLTVAAVKAGANEAVRVIHYRGIDAPAYLPGDLDIAATLGRRLDHRTATMAAGAPLTTSTIVEAARALDTAAMQAWLVERHEAFNLTAATLVSLADAGVPGSVTDVMVAATYPDEFHFSRGPAPTTMMDLSPTDSARIANDYLYGRRNCDPLSYYSPFDWGVNPCSTYYGAYRYGFGYPGYRFGYGYGYSPFGYGGYGYGPAFYGGVYTGPVVIVSNTEQPHGRAVKGQGYTRGGSSSSGSSSGSSSSTSSGGSSASSGSSSSSSGSSSSSSSGRTAHPRPPAH
jgi:uncharacterized membrane protein YgcG